MINQFKDDYKKLINDFSVIDENDPITLEKLNKINEILDTTYNEFNKIKSDLKKKKVNFDKKNNHTTKKYNKKIENIEEIYQEKIANNKENHTLACNKLKEKLEQFKKDSDFFIQQIEIDFEFFMSSIEQSKMILFDDFMKNKKRYDYQLNEAKISYSEVVLKNNIDLENKTTEINNNYFNKSLNLKREAVNSTLKIQEKIAVQEKELKLFNNMVSSEKNSLKEKYRKESSLLNEDIKKIINEKNANLDTTKNEYNQTIQNLNLEKEEKKIALHNKSQAILKEFVTKINEIDEETNNLKDEFEKCVLEIKRDYYENVYDKTKTFHKELENLYTSSLDKKQINKMLKFKNKQYMSEMNFIKKNTQYQLIQLTKDYNIKLNKNKTTKTLLELDKNYDIKNLTDEEQFNNKYYQEKSNIYENDYNFYIKNINTKFNQKANEIKLRSEKRIKLLERNHNGIDINYSKRIESITNNINKLKQELVYEKELERINTIYEENKYKNILNLTKATNLLEIEKNKLLKEYNISRYNYHINELELDKSYGIKKLDLENDYKEINKNLELKNIKLLLEKNIITTSYAIKKEQIYENFNKDKINIVKNNSHVIAKEKYINTLKDNNLFYLNLIKDSFKEFSKLFLCTYNNIIDIVYRDIELSINNISYLDKLISLISKIFNNLFSSFFNNTITLINDTTNEKIAFIHEFRYKKLFDELKDNYNNIQQISKNTKLDIENKIDLNLKTIDNVRNKIFTLINDNEMIENAYKYNKKKNYSQTDSKILSDNKLKIDDYKEKIDNYQKINKMLYVDLSNNAKIIKNNIMDYKKNKKELQDKKYFDTKVFICFKENTNNIYYTFNKYYSKYEKIKEIKVKNGKNLLAKTNSFKKYLARSVDITNSLFSDLFMNYAIEISKENQKRTRINKEKHANEINAYTKKLNEEIANYNKDYNYAIEKQNKLLDENSILINDNNSYYEKLLLDAYDNYILDGKNLKYFFGLETNEFYENYYALNDNTTNIINHHQTLLKNNKNDYKNKKQLLYKKLSSSCEKADDNLKKYIEEKNAAIQNLPIIYKNTSKALEKSVKKTHNDLNQELKEAKLNHFNERKNLDKVISDFKEQLDDLIVENQHNLNLNINIEEKNSQANLKQTLKTIKITL